jgi:hypothetical protein
MLLHNLNLTLLASFNVVNIGLHNLKDRFSALQSVFCSVRTSGN